MGKPFLEFENVTVLRDDVVALDHLDLRIDEGERVAVLGPNGAGKSTLVHALTRELHPLAGHGPASVRVYGRELWDLFELRGLLGVVTSELVRSCTGRYTVLETVLSGFFGSIGIWPHHEVTAQMRERAGEALDLLQLADLAGRHLTTLSSGQVRRAVIARALVHRPRALVLDEPTTSLDVRGKREMREAIRRLASSGATIVLITHQLEDVVPEIDRVVTLRGGRILHDGPKQEVLREGPLRELFGAHVRLRTIDGVHLLL